MLHELGSKLASITILKLFRPGVLIVKIRVKQHGAAAVLLNCWNSNSCDIAVLLPKGRALPSAEGLMHRRRNCSGCGAAIVDRLGVKRRWGIWLLLTPKGPNVILCSGFTTDFV